MLFGTIEEISEAEARAQLETNLFGTLWVTQAALPIMRAQRSGHIIQVSSIGGVNAFPTIGLYHASKWGLEGFSQALAALAAVRRNNVPGDPEATGPAILKVVDAEDPPLRIFFGSVGLPMIRTEYAKRIETWEKWNDVSLAAQGNLAAEQVRR